MTRSRLLLASAALLLLGTAMPAMAEIDAAAVTCGQFKAADGPGKDAIGRAVLLWTRDTQNAQQAGTLPSQFANFTKSDVRQRIEQKCSGQPAGANVIARLQTSA